MKLTEELYESAKDIWASYHIHPFVAGIGSGELDLERFRYFMIQDYLYLLDYAKVFALGVTKARDENLMRFFAKNVENILNGEMKIHKCYMERLHITKEQIKETKAALDNTSYTNYMLWVAQSGGVLEIMVAILACAWSYEEIGKNLAKIEGSTAHPFYGEWILGYACPEYAKGNEEIFEFVNQLGEGCTKEQLENLKEIFVNCSRYEYGFWELSYKLSK